MNDDITGREKNEAEEAIEQAGKKIGHAISNSSGVQAAKSKILAAVLSFIAPAIPVILALSMGVVLLIGVVNFGEAIKEGFVKTFWGPFAQISEYDEERLQAWNGAEGSDPLDPDKTALIYQQLVSTNNAGEPVYLEKYGSNEVIDSLSQNSVWRDVMRNEQVMFSQEDMTYILQRAFDKNNEMFRMKHTHYTYDGWELKGFEATPGAGTTYDLYHNPEMKTETSNEDEIYENLTREHIEGEEDEHGDKKFATHWQDAFALTYFFNIENWENWGSSEDSKYKPRDHGIDDKEVLAVNDVRDYYITKSDLRMICDIFDYNFTYYWDEIASDVNNYYFQTYKAGGYTTGYRYRRIPDPETDPAPPYSSPDEYNRINQDLKNPYEYLSYPDHLAYDEHTLPFTQFTPESCPNTISNTIESYKYIYTPIYETNSVSADTVSSGSAGAKSLVHLDEAGETDYTPDPWNFKPPNGDYCIGRWHVVDPREFIDTMALLCPWYKMRTMDENGQKWIDQSGYNWVQEMIDHYNLYLSYLPGTSDHTMSRMDYFNHIADLYTNKKIEVFYEGTKYDGMDEYFANLENRLLHPGNDLYIAFDIDGTLDMSRTAEDTETLRAGVVDAFKWMEQYGIKYVVITAASDLDKKKEWLQDKIFSHMEDTSGFKGAYHVTRRERYNYCRSHGIDILVDDTPSTISKVSQYMPVIEVHCSDWSEQPSGPNIFEIDDFTEFPDAVLAASAGLPAAADYSEWTVELNTDSAKDTFYNYQQKPESHKYPFYSYGVTYHNKEERHLGGEDGDDGDPGGTPLPEVPIGEPQGQVYIYKHAGHTVDGWYYLYEGSDVPLDTGNYYSKSQIHAMMSNLEGRGGIDFTSATDAVYDWNQATGADVAAMCAIIITEGGATSPHGKDHWNFFDFTASDGESAYLGSHRWWDAKADCATIGEAMVRAMNKILRRYWEKGQNTFYRMCFNQYGYPQSREEAIARDANPGFSHCYCPWWEDTGYITKGYDSKYTWCNTNGKTRMQFATMAD